MITSALASLSIYWYTFSLRRAWSNAVSSDAVHALNESLTESLCLCMLATSLQPRILVSLLEPILRTCRQSLIIDSSHQQSYSRMHTLTSMRMGVSNSISDHYTAWRTASAGFVRVIHVYWPLFPRNSTVLSYVDFPVCWRFFRTFGRCRKRLYWAHGWLLLAGE